MSHAERRSVTASILASSVSFFDTGAVVLVVPTMGEELDAALAMQRAWLAVRTRS